MGTSDLHTSSNYSSKRLSDDSQDIAATLAGDTSAFDVLVNKYQDRLYNALLRVLGSAEDARDVSQEAFAQAFLKLNTFQGSAAFYTWLYRIAFNRAMTHRRRARPTLSVEQVREQSGLEPLDGQGEPDRPLSRQERAGQVKRALDSLSEEHRRVLVLREIEDCSYEAISEILELPIGTVRSRLFRARLEMREQLKLVLGDDVDEL